MVELRVIDSSSVSVPNGTMTGPGQAYFESVTLGGVTYTQGLVQVVGGTATQPLGPLTSQQAQALPFWAIGLFVLGLLVAKAVASNN